jgi:hypothetical protein
MEQRLQAAKRLWTGWSDMSGACVLATAAICFLGSRFTPVRFDGERIDVEVTRQTIHVHGLYHYQNSSHLPALLTLATPFPVDPDHLTPDAIALAEVEESGRIVKSLELRGPQQAPSVRLLFRPREAKWIQLDYWQATRMASGRYLLSTTRDWGRPIAQAAFRLLLPEGYRLLSTNYPVSTAPAASRCQAFTFSRTNFYPTQDWQFSWRENRAAAGNIGGAQ